MSDYSERKAKLDDAIREFLKESGVVTGWALVASVLDKDGEELYSFHQASGQARHSTLGLMEMGKVFWTAAMTDRREFED